jgi:tetratricopeptide (TPR) repeat protein
VGAFDFIEAHRLPGEVWNEDAWGGAFLWRFWPGRRDFVDNRLDVFDEAFFLREYVPVRSAAPGWEAILDRHGVNTLLMEITDRPIGIQEAAFRSPGWALVYWDDRAEVFVRVSPRTRDLVGRFGYRIVNPNNLLESLRRRDTLPRAIAELERAVAAAPRSWRALNGLGVAYGMAGRYVAASRMFQRAIAANPRADAARSNLETARRHLGSRGSSDGPGA